MYKKAFLFFLLSVIIIMFFYSCEATTESQNNQNNSLIDTTGNIRDHEKESDYIWKESDVIPVTLTGASASANNSGVTIAGSNITITLPGTYQLSGTLNDGQITVNSPLNGIVRLIFNNVNISCSSSAPVYIKDAKKVVIFLPEKTDNYLIDGSTYTFTDTSVNEPRAALFSKTDLTIFGIGSLNVTGNYNDGISTTDGLIIKSGNIKVTSADDGIRGKDYLVIKDGNISVNSQGDALVSDNIDDVTKGYISVENGSINITTAKDAVDAKTDVIILGGTFNITTGGGSSFQRLNGSSEKGIKGLVSVIINGGLFNINSADDAVHSNGIIKINNGTFSISSGDDGMHADSELVINTGDITINTSFEGIESADIIINNGNISVVSTDDGINGTIGTASKTNDGSLLSVNGGNIFVNSETGDGVDCNGNIQMNGGTLVVDGPKTKHDAGIDVNGSLSVSGGFLIYTGPFTNKTFNIPDTTSAQNSIVFKCSQLFFESAIFHVQDMNGNEIFTFSPKRSCYYLVISSPGLISGNTYSIYTGGSYSGTEKYGILTGGKYTGGVLMKTFSLTGKVTNVSL